MKTNLFLALLGAVVGYAIYQQLDGDQAVYAAMIPGAYIVGMFCLINGGPT